jgi:arsenite methyltransferase
MVTTKIYENLAASGAAGDFLRPGGLALTERALAFCSFPSGVRILDVGCGAGGTVEYLINNHRLRAVGVDPSAVLLEYGRRRCERLLLVLAAGEDLPFADSVWDGVLVECSLSVANNADRVLGECARVLAEGGRLMLSDLYLRADSVTVTDCCLPSSSDTTGIMSREDLMAKLKAHGLEVMFWEDQSRSLKEFVARLILSSGSAAPCFWCPVDQGKGPGGESPTTFELIVRAKPGYFLCVAQKSGHH